MNGVYCDHAILIDNIHLSGGGVPIYNSYLIEPELIFRLKGRMLLRICSLSGADTYHVAACQSCRILTARCPGYTINDNSNEGQESSLRVDTENTNE